MHDRGKRGLNGLRGTGGDGDFVCGVVMTAIKCGRLLRDPFAQRKNTGHRRILVVTCAHGGIHHVDETRIAFEIRKALPEIDCADFLRKCGHGGENGGADVRKF